ncbi:MAG: hypothetical protein ABR548_13085 [Actinomycetota bacterium]|nr:hypothetical protein [Actinomycetota bacterium]
MDRAAKGKALGKRALWGRVGYVGEAFAAADGTYPGVNISPLNFVTKQDAGSAPMAHAHPAAYGNLIPLVLAAMWETSFAKESGKPLSTWSN